MHPLLAGALALATVACDHDPPPTPDEPAEHIGDVLPLLSPAAPEALPRDRQAMLAALAPLPTDALLVVYAIEGPAGIEGTLEVLARPGGHRRENWTIEVPLGDEGTRRLAGSTIQTPDGVWIEGREPSTLAPSPLGALADAALALDDDQRRTVLDQLARHRATLASARADEPPPSARVLDVPCHVTRVATIEMCMWEATGLPLRYESDALRLRAVNIDLDASIGEHAFDLPFEAPRARPEFDAPQALRRLLEGDLSALAPYLHPGLRLPTA